MFMNRSTKREFDRLEHAEDCWRISKIRDVDGFEHGWGMDRLSLPEWVCLACVFQLNRRPFAYLALIKAIGNPTKRMWIKIPVIVLEKVRGPRETFDRADTTSPIKK